MHYRFVSARIIRWFGPGRCGLVLDEPRVGLFGIPDSLSDTAYLATGLLSALPDQHPLREKWLPLIADGSVRIALGHPVNPWVADAHLADLLLLAHPTPGGTEWHALTPDQVNAEACPSIDASRRLATITWQATDASRIADASSGQKLADDLLDRGALGVSAQLLGLAQRMLDLTVDYAAQRKQFGKPIGSFQAVKHQLADIVTKVEFAKPVLYRAANALAQSEAQRSVRVSHAKIACADAGWFAARKAIQVHGAMGYTWEVDLQMFMKRAWVLDAAWGDRAFHKQRLADALMRDDSLMGPGATFNSTL